MHRYKLRTIDVVEEAHFADSLQRGDQNGFSQHCKSHAKTNINGFLKIVPCVTKTPGNRLSDDDGGGFTIVLVQKNPDVVGHLVTVQMFDQEFFSPSGQIRGTGDFNPVFVVQALLSGQFCDAICIICAFVKPLVVGDHLSFQTLNIEANKGVFFPQIHLLLRRGHLHSDAVHGDPLSSTR